MREYKFRGIPSGDYEAFCFDVTKEEYERITGKKPKKWDKSKISNGLYRLYPDDLFEDFNGEVEVEIKIKRV